MGAPSLRSRRTSPHPQLMSPHLVRCPFGTESALVESHWSRRRCISSWAGSSEQSRCGGRCFPGSVSRALPPVAAPAEVRARPSLTTACRAMSQERPAVCGPGAPASAAGLRDPRLLQGSHGALTDSLHKGNSVFQMSVFWSFVPSGVRGLSCHLT